MENKIGRIGKMTKRFFVDDLSRRKKVIENLFGKNQCFVCGFKLVLDIHHIYNYKKNKRKNEWDKMILKFQGRFLVKDKVDKTIFLCPNCHAVYTRLIDNHCGYPEYFKANYPKLLYDLKLIKKRIKFISKNKNNYYNHGHFYKKWYVLIPNNMGMKGVNFLERKWIKKEDMHGTPKCKICGISYILDSHHIKKDKRIVMLCPNHHYMIHRLLKDVRGDKLTLKEIKKGIFKIEKEKIPYYREVSRIEFHNSKYKQIRY